MLFEIIGILVTIVLLYYYVKYFYVPKSTLNPLLTTWGENLDKNKILPDYPRPQFKRESFLNLNGTWQYAIRESGEEQPEKYDGNILVPFSPESILSQVKKQLKPGQKLYYLRKFTIPEEFNVGKLILHFGAVDQTCEVKINGNIVGSHDGGYLPFSFDITSFVNGGENEIQVIVTDELDHNGAAHGKQTLNRGGIWYTATSGIWQTVWIESVPEIYLKSVRITPNYDSSSVTFYPDASYDAQGTVTIYDGKQEIKTDHILNQAETTIHFESFKSWSPEDPHLYKVVYKYGQDVVESYFGMRKFSVETHEGIPRLFLNNKPYFHNGLLDQGYWSDGLYTAPSDLALKYDIEKMKSLGFNMLRKHIKIEPLRWYYHCDKLGMLVWQDAVSGGSYYSPLLIQILPLGLGKTSIKDDDYQWFGRSSKTGRENYYRDLKDMINHLYNCTCIATWVPFNEGWGQFDAAKAVEEIKKIDETRHIDHASGWHDQGCGDFKSLHIYFKPVKISSDKLGRPVVLSEFGGYSLGVPDHNGSNYQFGYAKYADQEKLNEAIEKLYKTEIIPQIPLGLSASVYTQVSDVEDEVNGLLTYDRRVCKADRVRFTSFLSELKI